MSDPAAVLTAAADKLRALADAATPGPWTLVKRYRKGTGILVQSEIHRPPLPGSNIPQMQLASPERTPDAELAAVMHPDVASALADLLGHAAADVRQCERANAHSPGAPLLQPMTETAVTLARAVLGTGR